MECRFQEFVEAEVVFAVQCEPEEMPVAGNVLASGDGATDRAAELEVLAQIEAGNVWAWCSIRVVATVPLIPQVAGLSVLSTCSYRSEQAYLDSELFDAMKEDALQDLNRQLEVIDTQFRERCQVAECPLKS